MKLQAQHIPWFLAWKGLLFQPIPKPIFLRTRFGIHTFFLKFPIDVLILDEKNRIVAIKQNLKPFRLFFWNPTYSRVLELPPGTIHALKLHPGDGLGTHIGI